MSVQWLLPRPERRPPTEAMWHAGPCVPFAFNVGPMPLAPDRTFVWVLRVGEQSWRETFSTLPQP